MKYSSCALLAGLTLVPLIGASPQQQAPAMGPGWAFPVTDKVQPPRGRSNCPRKGGGQHQDLYRGASG